MGTTNLSTTIFLLWLLMLRNLYTPIHNCILAHTSLSMVITRISYKSVKKQTNILQYINVYCHRQTCILQYINYVLTYTILSTAINRMTYKILTNENLYLTMYKCDMISFSVSNCHKPCLPELNAHWLTLCI